MRLPALRPFPAAVLATVLLFTQTNAHAQSCRQADADTARTLAQMRHWGSYNDQYDEAKLAAATQNLHTTLYSYAREPSSWQCTFPLSAKEGLSVVTAADRRLRAYSWDLMTGGTMHFFNGFLQYRADDGSTRILDNGSNSDAVAIFNADLGGKHPGYWLVEYTIGSTRDHAQSATLYQISGNRLVRAKLVQTQSRRTDHLSFNYDTRSLQDSDTLKLFRYDPPSRTLSFPVVLPDPEGGSGILTDKHIRYRFNGRYFVRLK